jgi:hypothetical protein
MYTDQGLKSFLAYLPLAENIQRFHSVRTHTCTRIDIHLSPQLPPEEEEEALRSFGFKEALARKLVDKGRVVEAARLMCELGKIVDAARLIDSKGSDVGREAIVLSAELHLTYALSDKCTDQQQSLQYALDSCKRLKAFDEEALKDAQKKLDEMLEVREHRSYSVSIKV